MLVPTLDVHRALAEMEAFRRRFEAGTRLRAAAHGAVHVEEADDALVLTTDLPGVRAHEIEVSVEGRRLSLRVQHEQEEATEGTVVRRERRSLALQHTFNLPPTVDAGEVDARLEQGVLVVRLPKRADATPRRITVQS